MLNLFKKKSYDKSDILSADDIAKLKAVKRELQNIGEAKARAGMHIDELLATALKAVSGDIESTEKESQNGDK